MTATLSELVTQQLVFNGLVTGLVFGLLAMGIVLIYRATRVINFAVGNMGLIGAGLMVLLVVQYDTPFWIAVVVALTVGTLYGAVVDLVVIRRLFTAPRVIVVVATIGIAQLSQAILIGYPDIDAARPRFPVPIAAEHEIGSVRVTGPQLTILLVVPAIAIALGWFCSRTAVGKSITASAENRDLARLAGIKPKRVSTIVWAIGGALATVSICLMAGQSGSASDLVTLGPSTLVRALAAAVIAGMVSFRRAFIAGIAIGVGSAVVAFNNLDQPGLVDFLVFLGVLVAVWFQSRRADGETHTFSFAPKGRPIPERLRRIWWVRQIDRVGLVVIGVIAVAAPLIVTQPSRQLLYTTILVFALCGLSLTILTGWAGQLSLGQMAFAGFGALLAAAFRRGLTFEIGWGDATLTDVALSPMTFGVSLLAAALVTAALAAVIGLGALRVRGQFLAVTTFAFALAASQFFYRRPMLSGGNSTSVPFRRTDLFGLDVSEQRTYYYVVLGVLGIVLVVVARLRRTGIGRITIGVRDNPDAAAAATVGPTRVKVRTFALAGGIAGLGGALLAGSLQSISFITDFQIEDSLLLVAVVVIGGLGSLAGPILGSLWVIGLPAFFPDNELVPLLTSSIGLLVLLLYFPGGFVQIGYTARDAFLRWLERRVAPVPPKGIHVLPELTPREALTLPDGVAALRAEGVTVRFGGNHAVRDVSIHVDANEIVGLIGTNGAGKSTLMNAVGGFLPCTGNVELLGRAVSSLPPAMRARRGLGRTFQAAALFPELTVRETVLVSLEAQHRAGLISSSLFLPRSIKGERANRAKAAELIDFLGLGRYADTYISELSTGTRRIVELGCLLALEARVLCLDEPTAGVAQRETEAFGPLLKDIRRELGASMLVIEHDMPLIMHISDRVYCLELGAVIAEGLPAEVRSDPAVIASYLGTDERAISRSGVRASAASDRGSPAEGARAAGHQDPG